MKSVFDYIKEPHNALNLIHLEQSELRSAVEIFKAIKDGEDIEDLMSGLSKDQRYAMMCFFHHAWGEVCKSHTDITIRMRDLDS
tara:strand:+ start:111 stop:362 length:252 start_codon:yes stop_codon:yes gene_type:complete